MPETRELTLSASAYDRLAEVAAAEGMSVRAYVERIADRSAHEPPGPGARGAATGPEPDRRLTGLGVGDPRTNASGPA
ncbi:hypothetical protein AB0N88_35660 [Streptomyces sp. NPDC093516]|uniref:hypothetical protein n=1 Tax=Streptomyces sp. NPDC093516 TaxID=3155304 RepID=UPI00341FCC98